MWAFGVVVYEIGRRPFAGDEVGDVLAAVIKDQPPWHGVPDQITPLLQRCLEKDPKKRLRHASSVDLLLRGRERLCMVTAAPTVVSCRCNGSALADEPIPLH